MNVSRKIILLIVALFPLALALGAFAQSESKSERRERVRKCRNWLKSASEFQAAGKYQEALEVTDSALLCDERNPDAYYNLGTLHVKLGDTLASINSLQLGISLAPLSSRLKLTLAHLYTCTNQWAAADSLIEATLAFKPKEPRALYLKGLLQLHNGDSTAALDLFDKALSISLGKSGE